MHKSDVLTKALAVVGALLVWFPIVATVVTAVAGSIRSRTLRFDYLMPAELFPFVVAGGGLLLWAALRARGSQREAIGWGLAMILALLIGGQALAVASGLASGETEPAGWTWALVIASLVGYALALVELGIAGLLLLRDVFQHRGKDGPVLPPV